MTKIGIVGIGDMGSGIAKNLIAGGFDLHGIDTLEKRMQDFVSLGGTGAKSLADLATDAVAVFVMVMTGAPAKGVMFGDDGLASHLPKG